MLIMLNQKGLAPILIVLLIAVAAGIGGYLFYTNYAQDRTKLTPPQTIQETTQTTLQPSPNPTATNFGSTSSAEIANWKTYEGKNFLISYPDNLNPTNKNYLLEVVESVQLGERDKQKIGSIVVSVSLGGETMFKNRKETYLTFGMYNQKEEEVLISGVKAWRISGTDDNGNFRQYTLFYKNDLEFEIDNFGISKNTYDQILSTFKFIR